MRWVVTRALLIALAAAGALLLGHAMAVADTTCQLADPESGVCLVWIQVPSNPGNSGTDEPKGTGSGHACYWDPSKQGLDGPPAGPVGCSTNYGYWSNQYNCYIQALAPQPPAGDPGWQGHQSNDGAVYSCYQPQTDLQNFFWSANTPPKSGAGPTPRDVAQLAMTRMDLRAIDIGITPEPGVGRVGVVGMPVWMWADGPNGHTYGPISASASAGGITVTATARVHQLTWLMGDGNKVVCRTAGTPYKTSYGKKASPDCGYVYKTSSTHRPGSKFTVTATSDWIINWAGAGQTGTIRLNGLRRSVQIAVGEAQVLVQ